MQAGFTIRLTDLCPRVEGRLRGSDVTVRGAGTDTRSITPESLFIALKGERFDGHAFVTQAREKGARAALVERAVDDPLPQVAVANTRLALGWLAAYWRRRFGCPVVAVTGSNGKTTVKEMIAAILAQESDAVLATAGNRNNAIGVPLTLLGLNSAHRFAVIEMGANRAGEIDYLSHLTRPDVALITNAAPAHLAGFGDLQGVVRAKGEIIQGLRPGGAAVLNADDPHCADWRALVQTAPVIKFGLTRPADVTAQAVVMRPEGSRFMLATPLGKTEVWLPLPGRHNVLNALAASAAAIALGLDPAHIGAALAALPPLPGRLRIRQGAAGVRVLDDTYNANPASLRAGLDLLTRFPGAHYLVLGDFAELGAEAMTWHRAMGKQARATGIDRLYTLGNMSRLAAETFGEGSRHFSEQQSLLAALRKAQLPNATLLVKGSRCMHLERLVAALCEGGGSS